MSVEEWLHPDGADYFNRYPIVFAFVSRWLLSPWAGDGVAWLYAARQWMNVIFVSTALALWYGFARCVSLGWWRWLPYCSRSQRRWCCSTATCSTSISLRCWPTCCLLVVVRNQRRQTCAGTVWALCLAALSGRSAVVLIFSLVLPLQRGLDGPRGRLWLGVPIAFGTVGLATSYNIAWEAHLNAVAWTSTSVVQSAMRRLGLSGDGFSERNLERTRWLGAEPKLIAYSTEFMLPLLLVTAVLVLTRLIIQRRRSSSVVGSITAAVPDQALKYRRQMLWSTGGTAALWVVVMKNLFVFHVYAGMVLLPFL